MKPHHIEDMYEAQAAERAANLLGLDDDDNNVRLWCCLPANHGGVCQFSASYTKSTTCMRSVVKCRLCGTVTGGQVCGCDDSDHGETSHESDVDATPDDERDYAENL